MTERNTRIRASQISSILPDDLEATNALIDGYVPKYDQATGKFTWIAQSGGAGSTATYSTSFNDGDLSSADVLVLSHNLDSDYLIVAVYDNNGKVIIPDEIIYSTSNIINIDLSSFTPLSGTWHVRVNGGAWEQDELKDSDNDTKVEVERNSDEDIIRFKTLNTDRAQIDANGLKLATGADVNEFSTDGTFGGNSDDAVPTEKAVKTYVDNHSLDASSVDDFTIKLSGGQLKVSDRLELNTMLNAFRIAINGSLSQYSMVDGINDEFEDETGVDTATSTNENYNSTNDYYSPLTASASIDSNTKLMIHANSGDISGQAHSVTYYGDAKINTSVTKFGDGALAMDGTGDYINLPDSDDWAFGSSNFTVDFWVRFASTPSTVVFFGQEADANNLWYMFLYNNTDIRFLEKVGGVVTTHYYGASWSPSIDTWYHVALVRNSSTLTLYIDGSSVSWGTIDTAIGTMTNISTTFDIANSNGSYLMDGYIDEFRVSNTARWTTNFTPSSSAYTADANTKLLLQFEEGDNYGGHNIEPQGNAKIDKSTKKWGDGSWYFDGSGDYLKLADHSDWDIVSSNADNWTIDFWVKFNVHSESDWLIEHASSASVRWYIWHSHGNGLSFIAESGTLISTGFGGEITDSNWHHIALIKVADEYAIYKDGIQVNYTQDSKTYNFTGSLYIGQDISGGSTCFNGYMDEIRIQNSNIFNASPNSTPDDTITVPDSEYSEVGEIFNMALQSNASTAEAIPDTARLVIYEEDVDAITVNTDLKGYVSRDGGSTWAQVTLSDEGDYENNKRILTGTVDLTQSGIGSGTSMKWKVESVNNDQYKIHGIGLLWD